jgi:hypothetical protein
MLASFLEFAAEAFEEFDELIVHVAASLWKAVTISPAVAAQLSPGRSPGRYEQNEIRVPKGGKRLRDETAIYASRIRHRARRRNRHRFVRCNRDRRGVARDRDSDWDSDRFRDGKEKSRFLTRPFSTDEFGMTRALGTHHSGE